MLVLPSRIFRLFVSSTFADLLDERSALHDRVFPRLRQLCEECGARFSPVDLRWGVSAEAAEDGRTMSICLDEIRRCRQTTPRPNFIILLGTRYGWRPLPSEIAIADVERLRATESLQQSVESFDALYAAIDRNAVPPVYCLRPGTGIAEVDREALDREVVDALASASIEAGWSFTRRAAFGGSATEQEIVCGLLDDPVLPAARGHVHAFFSNAGAPDAVPVRDDRGSPPERIDTDACRLHELKERLRMTLGDSLHEYAVDANGESKLTRLDHLCEDVYASLSRIVAEEADRFTRLDALDREIDAHAAFAHERNRIFTGRAAVVSSVDSYLAGTNGHVLVVIGASGSGKSSLIARALTNARRDHPSATIVSRFVGSTPEASSGTTLLRSLSVQIARNYGGAAPPAYADYPRMAGVFRDALKLARPERPLMLFVDALDQLPPLDPARNLTWLPLKDLPPHVRVVTTVSSDARALAATLQEKVELPYRIQLEPMPPDEAGELLALWLADAHRDLQGGQRDAVMTGFSRSGLPLYLRFAFEESRLWRSFDAAPPLSGDPLAIIRQTFARLSDPANHGGTLVQRSMGYLTAAKEGLTEDEIVDVLSADQTVMLDFRARFPKSPDIDCLPLVVWSRLYYDLKPYLTERGGHGSAVMNFFHRQMRQVTAADYLDSRAEAERHAALARYFQSRPAVLGPQLYNARTLSELPYQLRKAGMWEDLEATLCDLAFIETKCAAGLIFDLLADYDAAILTAGLPPMAKVRVEAFGRFVRSQAHLLSTHPHLTLQQALNEPDVTPPARAAALAARTDSRPRFRRIGKSQHPSPCIRTLYGHTSYVNACDVSPDDSTIASASSDGDIKIWDAAKGQEMFVLRGPQISAESCHFSPDGTRLVSGTRSGLVMMWDVTTGDDLWSAKVHDRPVPCCRFSFDGRFVVSASWDGRVVLLDARTGAELTRMAGHTGDASWACSRKTARASSPLAATDISGGGVPPRAGSSGR